MRRLHREFLRAGSEVMVALTYYAHRAKLCDVDRADDLHPVLGAAQSAATAREMGDWTAAP